MDYEAFDRAMSPKVDPDEAAYRARKAGAILCDHCKKPILLSRNWGYYFHTATGLKYCADGKHCAEPEETK